MTALIFSYKQYPSVVIHRFRVCVPTSYRSVERHDRRDRAVDLLGALLLFGLDVASRVGSD